jgi:hypothetical protein
MEDGAAPTSTLNPHRKSTLWDPPSVAMSTSKSLQGPVYRTDGAVRHTRSKTAHDPTNGVRRATPPSDNKPSPNRIQVPIVKSTLEL